MNTTGIASSQATHSLHAASARRHHETSSLQTRAAEGDSLELSSGATQAALAGVPDSVMAAVADLQGSQTTLSADFRTIGDYFAQNGGREALDAFMAANFTQDQLRAFPPPEDGWVQAPGARELPLPVSQGSEEALLTPSGAASEH